MAKLCMAHASRLGQLFKKDFSFSYPKILGETNFHTREIPRSGSKAKDGGERERKIERW